MKKTLNFYSLIMICVSFLLLTSCSAPSAKSESDICADIQSNDRLIEEYNIKTNSSTITKRQTNPDSKTDYVWVSIVGEAEEFTYYADYELTYVLYNDGWILEGFDKTNLDYVAKTKPSMEAIESILADTYDNYAFVSENLVNQNHYEYLYYVHSKISSVLSSQHEVFVDAYFDRNDGWYIESIQETSESLYWDLNGTWEYNDENIKISAIVHDFVEDDAGDDDYILTLEYTCITDNGTISSDGIIEHHLHDHSDYYGYSPYYLMNTYVNWNDNDPHVYIDIPGTTGEGLRFEVWDGKEWYDQYLTRISQ